MSLQRRRANKAREVEAEIREQQRAGGAGAARGGGAGPRGAPSDAAVLRAALVRAAGQGCGRAAHGALTAPVGMLPAGLAAGAGPPAHRGCARRRRAQRALP
jgi:hypothetical protein